jgi:triosephosphate isomerase
MILINFKIYKETFGDKAVELAKVIKEVGDKYKIRMVVTASALDALRLKDLGVEVWLQNVDQYLEGKHTGWVSAEQAMSLGIKGGLVNHFEHQVARGTALKIIKNKPKGFEIMCCAKSTGQIERWMASAKPDYILYEPPELIGSSTDSVASKPESIKRAVELCGDVPLMVGAGVKSKEDVLVSLKMGAKSVGLASGFVLSKDPKRVLEDIASGFETHPTLP